MIEAQSRYINGLISPVLSARKEGKALSLSPKAEKVKEYNTRLQEELQASSFNDPNCNSWYKNEKGLITNNWSRTVIDYQNMLSTVDYENFEAEGSGTEIARRRKQLKIGRVKEESSVSDRTILTTLGLVSTAAVVGGFLWRNSSRVMSSIRAR